jgi:hypothetical protein
MGSIFRQGIIALTLGALLFCISCEKHPLGQMPEVQREQPDPAKEWSEGKSHSEEPSNTHKPGEAHEGH